MPFDGNGNWVADFSAINDRDANIKILASRFDNIHQADLKESFENCLTKDMQVKPSQNFNANNFRLINVANPVSGTDAVNLQTMTSGANTYTGNNTFSGNDLFTGANTFSGNTVFSGTTYLPPSVKLSKQDSNLEGGQLDFLPGDNEPNANQSMLIDRYNGQLRFFGSTSGGSPVSFNIDMQNDKVYATPGITSTFAYLSIPNYSTVIGISSGYTATSNGIVRFFYKEHINCSVSVGSQTPFAHSWAGGDYGNQTFMDWLPVAKGKQITFSGIESCYFEACYGG